MSKINNNSNKNLNQSLNKNRKKIQWLAGLIDGDGCFSISDKEYACLEITVSLVDEHLLQQIKQLFGGTIKPKGSVKALRYRLHNRSGLKQLLHAVNGYLRNSIRQQQFKRVLDIYNIEYIEPDTFSWAAGYASGLLDSDGSVVLSVKQHSSIPNQKGCLGKINRLQHALKMQLSIKITQKYRQNVAFLMHSYLGNIPFGYIVFDKSQKGYYSWTISSKKEITLLLDYISKYPCYSKKAHRLRLIKQYFKLYEQKAHLAEPESYLKRRWSNFANDWYKYDI